MRGHIGFKIPRGDYPLTAKVTELQVDVLTGDFYPSQQLTKAMVTQLTVDVLSNKFSGGQTPDTVIVSQLTVDVLTY
jgi:hypothetical protein